MKRIAIYGNTEQHSHTAELTHFMNSLRQLHESLSISIERNYYAHILDITGIHGNAFDTFSDNDYDAELVLSIGGDGTFLNTARHVGVKQTPIMGINSGHLGYLSAARISDADSIIDDILNESIFIQPRSVIQVSSSELRQQMFALNEVAVLKQHTASMITIECIFDDNPAAIYRGDGLIVSTPTGSTGYNLSVGGPIVAPSAPNWVISPIAPHSLNMRPLVVSDSVNIALAAGSRYESFMLSVDGKSVTLPIKTHIYLSRAPYSINLVMRRGHSFIDTLRTKLLWGTDSL